MTFVLSALPSRTDRNGVFVTQRRRFRVIVFSSARLHVWHRVAKKPKEDAGSLSVDRPIRSVLSRTSPLDGPISRVHKEKTRLLSRPIRFFWQDDKADTSSYGQVTSAHPIKRLWSILWTNHKKEASAQPITSFGRIIFWTKDALKPFDCRRA